MSNMESGSFLIFNDKNEAKQKMKQLKYQKLSLELAVASGCSAAYVTYGQVCQNILYAKTLIDNDKLKSRISDGMTVAFNGTNSSICQVRDARALRAFNKRRAANQLLLEEIKIGLSGMDQEIKGLVNVCAANKQMSQQVETLVNELSDIKRVIASRRMIDVAHEPINETSNWYEEDEEQSDTDNQMEENQDTDKPELHKPESHVDAVASPGDIGNLVKGEEQIETKSVEAKEQVILKEEQNEQVENNKQEQITITAQSQVQDITTIIHKEMLIIPEYQRTTYINNHCKANIMLIRNGDIKQFSSGPLKVNNSLGVHFSGDIVISATRSKLMNEFAVMPVDSGLQVISSNYGSLFDKIVDDQTQVFPVCIEATNYKTILDFQKLLELIQMSAIGFLINYNSNNEYVTAFRPINRMTARDLYSCLIKVAYALEPMNKDSYLSMIKDTFRLDGLEYDANDLLVFKRMPLSYISTDLNFTQASFTHHLSVSAQYPTFFISAMLKNNSYIDAKSITGMEWLQIQDKLLLEAASQSKHFKDVIVRRVSSEFQTIADVDFNKLAEISTVEGEINMELVNQNVPKKDYFPRGRGRANRGVSNRGRGANNQIATSRGVSSDKAKMDPTKNYDSYTQQQYAQTNQEITNAREANQAQQKNQSSKYNGKNRKDKQFQQKIVSTQQSNLQPICKPQPTYAESLQPKSITQSQFPQSLPQFNN